MIQFEIDSNKEGVEVYLDSKGVDELIIYLNFIKNEREHMHLVVGNELTEGLSVDNNKIVKHVKLIYMEPVVHLGQI